jgi:pyruvate dehydrogenase E2 component (dihydrolipoamide acetyltransferase)
MNDKARLFADVSGKAGPRLVLLHGFGGSHSAWRYVVGGLADSHRTIAYDLPGHGRSLKFPAAGPPKVAASAVLHDLDARGLERVHLVGHSMGGAVAVLIALAEPRRVASLTLLAPGGFGEIINVALIRRFAAATARHELAACLAEMLAAGREPDTEEVARIAGERREPGRSDLLMQIAAAMTRNGRQGAIPRSSLSALAMPATVAWGRLDRMLPVEQAIGLPENFKVRLFEHAGHMLPQECPGAIVDLIADTVFAGEQVARA